MWRKLNIQSVTYFKCYYFELDKEIFTSSYEIGLDKVLELYEIDPQVSPHTGSQLSHTGCQSSITAGSTGSCSPSRRIMKPFNSIPNRLCRRQLRLLGPEYHT